MPLISAAKTRNSLDWPAVVGFAAPLNPRPLASAIGFTFSCGSCCKLLWLIAAALDLGNVLFSKNRLVFLLGSLVVGCLFLGIIDRNISFNVNALSNLFVLQIFDKLVAKPSFEIASEVTPSCLVSEFNSKRRG